MVKGPLVLAADSWEDSVVELVGVLMQLDKNM